MDAPGPRVRLRLFSLCLDDSPSLEPQPLPSIGLRTVGVKKGLSPTLPLFPWSCIYDLINSAVCFFGDGGITALNLGERRCAEVKRLAKVLVFGPDCFAWASRRQLWPPRIPS